MTDLDAQRRFFAEEIETQANLKSAALVEALAAVPRERFLAAGPWTIRTEADLQGGPRQTVDADPRRVYHNVAVAIDMKRQLFNGAPSLVAMAIDTLGLAPGKRVLHLGTGTGYYTAILAHCVGPSGHVLGLEVDADLATASRRHLVSMPWVEVRQGDGSSLDREDGQFDAMLINAGVTHPVDAWLDAMSPGGRIVLPLTATMPVMPGIGKGLLLALDRTDDTDRWPARVVTFVAIYSALGLRDDSLNGQIGQALAKNPFPGIRELRRDQHEPSATCWLHAPRFCLALGPEGTAKPPAWPI
jgi:protein-L-isoaspartate(D-aspartate) O-methyltransferase